jgi:pimeloyl-ACP methyl ester carboxylesterase
MDANNIFLIGHSRGGGLVILKTAEDKRIKGLVTWAAISDLSNRWPKDVLQQWKNDGVLYIYNTRTEQNMPLYYQLVENFKQNKSRLDIPRAAARISVPWLICHGTSDETLPVSMATDLKSWNTNSKLFIIDSATHTFGGSHPWENNELASDTITLVEKTSEFLKKIQ